MSPVGLGVLATLNSLAPRHLAWERLSAVSQTYGAVSVFISAAALAGVAPSLAYEARQTRTQNEESHRSAHRELVILTFSDPSLPSWHRYSAGSRERRFVTLTEAAYRAALAAGDPVLTVDYFLPPTR
ncbi:DUF6082 family protein [Streptomyces sp. NPDC051105]|uniref:DUF6082 family protein n=1 Tax=Streptomyces sp. NPDC051105 TaxID=3154843 RepID=UPI0034173DC6